MGISDLWNILHPTSTTLSLRKLAVDAFTSPHRAFRLGIDISLWICHAQHVSHSAGPNPALRTLFYRFAALLSQGFIPILVFDGPHRPSLKRGKRVFNNASPHMFSEILILLRAFGFEARQAPGEAEAELAYMSQRGEIDAVLTDDSDALVFGAKVVIRNWSTTLSGHASNRKQNHQEPSTTVPADDFNGDYGNLDAENKLANDIQNSDKFVPVYKAEKIEEQLNLDRKKLILFALLAGGDYHMQGLPGCGKAYSYDIAAKTNLASMLYGALQDELKNSDNNITGDNIDSFDDTSSCLQEVADRFVTELAHILTHDPDKIFAKKKPSLAKKLESGDGNFCIPDWQVMNRYANPITSYHPKYTLLKHRTGKKNTSTVKNSNKILLTPNSPDIPLLTQVMQEYFEFTPAEVLQKYRSVLFSGLIMEEMRRTILRQDQVSPIAYSLNESPSSPIIVLPSSSPISSPRKSTNKNTIDLFFKSTKPGLERIDLDKNNENDSHEPKTMDIIRYWNQLDIKGERQHWNTDKTLEYRAEIYPSQFVIEIRKHLWPEEINMKKIRQRKTEESREKALEIYKQKFPERVVKKSLSQQQRQQLEDDPAWRDVLEQVKQESLAKKRNRKYDDPDSSLRVWLPANAVEVVYGDAVKTYKSNQEAKLAATTSAKTKSRAKTSTSTKKTPLKKKNSATIVKSKSRSPSPKQKSLKSKHTLSQKTPISSLYLQTALASISTNSSVNNISGSGEVIKLDSSDDNTSFTDKNYGELPDLKDLFESRSKKKVHVEPEFIDLVSD